MKMSKEELKRLQLEWYQKLADDGFRDVEVLKGEELILRQSINYPFRNTNSFTREMKEQYFTVMGQFALDENAHYRNEVDKYILIRHSEGAKIKDIVLELHAKEMPRGRASVRFIIRRYEMIWGIKFYTDKQLNRRPCHKYQS